MKLFLHVYDKSTPTVFDTVTCDFSNQDGTVKDLQNEIQKIVPEGYKLNSIAPSYGAKPFTNLDFGVSNLLSENASLFAEVEKAKPKEEDPSLLATETITKYKFYENDEENVRVVIELKDIAKHPKDKITCRFLDRSFELKILAFGGKNLYFAVPRAQNKIIPEQSKYWVKDNKLIINLRKFKKDDSWHSLFRTKAIGEDD